ILLTQNAVISLASASWTDCVVCCGLAGLIKVNLPSLSYLTFLYLSLSRTHAQICTQSHTHTHVHTHIHALTLSHTDACRDTHTHTLTITHHTHILNMCPDRTIVVEG